MTASRSGPACLRALQSTLACLHKTCSRELAAKLDVAASTISRILKGSSRVTPEMALRLSKAIGRTAESWLLLQDNHDLWVARQHVDLKRVSRLRRAAA